ncbi:Tyrosine-protein kinase Fer [Frankliniella fusca]|uniref:Tyrosine-protein kinase Fer n=1 Tax=Frankliniella fusca TaxID=407009 RepID=A0AAE1LRV3_9NEOP|nr:Tyrosine-protein kinase Fer [Frankliniella fusca]
MGFSAALQSKAAHEALLCRQDAELRLLDLMRRCILSKVRSDRDYALALSALVQQGLKVERAEDLAGSLVAKAWRGMLEELDNTGKAVRQNADCLERDTLEKLNTLHAEKRKARKQYQEEHSRIAQQFATVSLTSSLRAEAEAEAVHGRGSRSLSLSHPWRCSVMCTAVGL